MLEPSETVRRAPVLQQVMRQSEPHGDMGRAAEMTAPPLPEAVEVTDMPKVAKFLVG